MSQAVDEVELRERRVNSRRERALPMRNIMFAMWGAALFFGTAYALSDENMGWSVGTAIFAFFMGPLSTALYGAVRFVLVVRDAAGKADEPEAHPGLNAPVADLPHVDPAHIRRHGGGSMHIIRAARHYVVVLGEEAIGISERFDARRDAKKWAENYGRSPQTTPVKYVVPLEAVEKVVLASDWVEVVTDERRVVLDGWFNRRDDSHHKQLVAMMEDLELVEQSGAVPGTWARVPEAGLQVEEIQTGDLPTRVRPVVLRWVLIPVFAISGAFMSLAVSSLTNGLLIAAMVTAISAVLLQPVGIEVDGQNIITKGMFSRCTTPWAQVADLRVEERYDELKKVNLPVLVVEDRSGKARALRFTKRCRKAELGQILQMLRAHGEWLGHEIPLLADFGCSPEQSLPTISCGGGASMFDFSSGIAEGRKPGILVRS